MIRCRLALVVLLAIPAASAGAQSVRCDPTALRDPAETVRSHIIAGVDGAAALDAWRQVVDNGGAIAWTVTEYSVDARSTFVFAFDREALRVYRAGALGSTIDRALDGCIDSAIAPEAVIPWRNIREMENKVKRAVIMAEGKYITREDLGLAEAGELSLNLRHVRQEAEKSAILRALSMTDHNVSAAAKLLGITRPTFYDLIKKYEMPINSTHHPDDD